jgi:hypothetical protein
MARLARLVLPGIPHHVTQRGNRRERTFFEDGDYALYLDLLADAAGRTQVEIWAYCLMEFRWEFRCQFTKYTKPHLRPSEKQLSYTPSACHAPDGPRQARDRLFPIVVHLALGGPPSLAARVRTLGTFASAATAQVRERPLSAIPTPSISAATRALMHKSSTGISSSAG